MSDTETVEAETIATTDKDVAEATGLLLVTPEEMRFLHEWSWGPDAHREACAACGEVMVFEKHPADWPNHPGKPGTVRVKVECPKCGNMQFTDGATEVEYVEARTKELDAEIRSEIAKRINAEVSDVRAADSGSAGDDGGATVS